jgi:hypothetical protein
MSQFQFAMSIAAGLVTWTSTTAILVWWLSGQFSSVRELVYKRSDMLAQKMEDHERLDEERFNNLGLRMQRVEIATDTNGRYIPAHRGPAS